MLKLLDQGLSKDYSMSWIS